MSDTAQDASRFVTALREVLQRYRDPAPSNPFHPELSYGRHFGPPGPDARPAAVLILLYRHEGVWKIPFTLRPRHLSAHAGQVSFPGGGEEAGETSEQCALREWTEELGPPQAQFEWLGQLPQLYVFNSNFRVTPCMAFSSRRPVFAASPAEVERVLEVPLAHLCDPGNAGAHWIRHGAVAFRTPHIAFGQDRIWGATAIMLGELLTRLRQIELPN